MEDAQGYPCPRCGYDPSVAVNIGYALPTQTILFGRYLVGKVLGQGGFGLTYIGWDISLGLKVAIKEFYPSGQVSRTPGERTLTWYQTELSQQAQQDGMEIFLKEARKMARVDSIPGVVRVRDLFRENGTAYIVMDFVEGETLKTCLRKNGPMSWNQAKEVFRSAIRSMEQVHEKGLIHRDLSPDNLMLTPEGKVEILDLGAAKDLNISSGASSMQVAKGGFSPLEQYTQRGGSGAWTDVYAMAATIYYTLTGILPTPAVDRIDEDTLSWTVPGLSTLPAGALDALKKAMAISAKNRLQTMKELEQGLFEEPTEKPEPVAEQKAVHVSEPEQKVKPAAESADIPEAEQSVKPARKFKRGIIAAVAAVLVLCVGTGLYLKVLKPTERKTIQPVSISAGGDSTVGVKRRGTAEAVGNDMYGQCAVDNWKYIVAVSAGKYHTVGLRSDGTVEAVGNNDFGKCDLASWRDVVAISAGWEHTVGLKNDGTVVAKGYNGFDCCKVGDWKDIVSVSAGRYHTVGLRSDGTVVATGYDAFGQCDVEDWKNIVAISAGEDYTVGLRSDGTVIAVGSNKCGQCNVGNWENIVAISAGGAHTVGLRSDGTVVAVGKNVGGRCDVDNWENIVAISAGAAHTVGLRRNGKVLAVGNNDKGQCDVSDWANIRVK